MALKLFDVFQYLYTPLLYHFLFVDCEFSGGRQMDGGHGGPIAYLLLQLLPGELFPMLFSSDPFVYSCEP